ncbi:MAG: DUF3422 domain-containing protein [Litoricolaceae bacterium]|nr:DUF3422 domain-containing protein [Litorivicinaceae bacterium]
MQQDPHLIRLEANRELHARPFPILNANCRLVHLCVRVSPTSRDEVRAWLREKIKDFPEDFHGHWVRPGVDSWVRVERHSEFVAITQVVPEGLQFTEVADSQWVDRSPQDVLVLARISSTIGGKMPADVEAVSTLRGGEVVAGSNFTEDNAGFTSWTIAFSDDPGDDAAGRLLQMILEIETYRTLAVMGMDKIRAVHPILYHVAKQLPKEPTEILGHEAMIQLLASLSTQESELHAVWEKLAWRIGANQAYHELVFQRLEQLNAKGLEGYVGIRHFLKRRLTPAVLTAETVMHRRSELAAQIDERAQLLRTQLQLNLQSQTRDLLANLDKSAERQIRLQSAVEGLSTVAITYYAVGLISPTLEPFVEPAFKDWVKAGLAPAVIGVVWWTLSRIRNRVSHNI